jgi:signal transduction histidine kinase
VRKPRVNWKGRWLTQTAILASIALVVFMAFYALDHYVTGGGGVGDSTPDGVLHHYVSFDPDKITDAVSALAAMIAAVLGIVITVVSIIVQLSADRYTGVAQMFLRDRTNIMVMAYYVIACVSAVWLSMSLQEDFAPRALALLIMAATTFGLVLMLPYFAYVFWFLEPANIIARIRHQAVRALRTAAHASPKECADLQSITLSAMEELTDITSNSISGKDKIIASRAVDALKDYCLDYLEIKHKVDGAWFTIHDSIRKNPDFVAMDPESLVDLEKRRTWFEWKILRQFLGIYNEALMSMRDINYLIAIDTRYIGEVAGDMKDHQLVALVFRYMNSYMRATLNARDVRTAYNVLNQYRLLVETMLRQGHGGFALEGVKHMNYYGQVSYDMNLTFVTETVAHDVSTLCQIAHKAGAEQQDDMLAQFLELDQPLQVKSQEKGLLGVRKAQVKLAAYYLTVGEEEKARLIARDMKDEPAQRLWVIRDQLARVTSKDFWEIIDRGRNFEYMPPSQRARMRDFFEWLGLDSQSDSGSLGLSRQRQEEPAE